MSTRAEIVAGVIACAVMAILFVGFQYWLEQDEQSCEAVCQSRGGEARYTAPEVSNNLGKFDTSIRNKPGSCHCEVPASSD